MDRLELPEIVKCELKPGASYVLQEKQPLSMRMRRQVVDAFAREGVRVVMLSPYLEFTPPPPPAEESPAPCP